MQDFLNNFWAVCLELAFPLFIGAAAAGGLGLLFQKDFLFKHLSGSSFSSVFKAVFLGLPLPLCSCGVLPLALSMRKKGAGRGAVNGFLVSTPQTGVDSFLVSLSFFSLPFAIMKLVLALTLGLAAGLVSSVNDKDAEVEFKEEQVSVQGKWYKRWWDHSIELLDSIWLWLFIGVVVSAVIAMVAGHEQIVENVKSLGLLQQMLLMLLVSLPMYVCATASIPIAASFVALGVHPAAALVFLIAGPATNAAAILPLIKVIGLRHVLIQLIVVIIGSITGAYFFSDYLRAEVFTDHCHDHAEWYQLLAAGLLLLVFIRGAYLTFMNSRVPQSYVSAQHYICYLDGINCQSCVAKIQRLCNDLPNIDFVRASKDEGLFEFRSDDLDEAELLFILSKNGFSNIRIEKPSSCCAKKSCGA